MRLYSDQRSGNCYKVRLMLAHLGADFAITDMNWQNGDTRAAAFLRLNPNGKLPLLVLEDGRTLSESNAILLHLAAGGSFIPADEWRRAKMYEWLFWEQYTHEPAIAVRRAVLVYGLRASDKKMRALLDAGERALSLLEQHLQKSEWLAAENATVADLSLYAYTHIAEEGGYELKKYPAVCAWLKRIRNLPGHVDINWRP